MNNPALYKKTCDILVDAYFNDTLQHRTCSACAVGNIVSANIGIGVFADHPMFPDARTTWGAVFITCGTRQKINVEKYEGYPKFQIDATGYTWQELAKIEYAFETAPNGTDEDRMFSGLMRVIEALDIIHGNTDAEITTTTKNRFNKTPQL